jgi:hypothetical protein
MGVLLLWTGLGQVAGPTVHASDSMQQVPPCISISYATMLAIIHAVVRIVYLFDCCTSWVRKHEHLFTVLSHACLLPSP